MKLLHAGLFNFRVLFSGAVLLSTLFLVSPAVFAETGISDKAPVSNPEEPLPGTKKSGAVRPVEAGPGGNIKIERKYRTRIESQYEWHAHLLWESRYVTEGRDNLAGKGLVSASTEFSLDEFSIVPWLADSPGADYQEFNLNIVTGTQLTEALIIYAGYNHIRARYQDEKASDNEISLDLAYKLIKHFHLQASMYHSFDANGSFMEMSAKYGKTVNKKAYLSLQGVLGVNAEYVPDGHNGLNHFQLRANAAYHPLTRVELYAYIGYNVAIDRDAIKYAGDEQLKDFAWGGAGFSYLF